MATTRTEDGPPPQPIAAGGEKAALETGHPPTDPSGRYLVGLSLGALGIVYGDIGTSPLYALREAFTSEQGVAASAGNVLGILSLIFWSLILIICVKYLGFVVRADNRGEGGTLALTSLVTPVSAAHRGRFAMVLMGLFATSLLYGEGMITPAITVLSAVEGLSVATTIFNPYILPITIVILIVLFSVQRAGTAKVGRVFGPITLTWFVVLALLGVRQIVRAPAVLAAANPAHALRFFVEHGAGGFMALGAVVLVVTGAEALYADMGHFGRRPIRLAWFAVVLPALLLNYFGQGALVLRDPSAVANPFFLMAPSWALFPLVVLATMAAVIASQALISGSYSLTMQAVQLGYMPRVAIEHTSEKERGQIYVPATNWVLMVACIGLVLGFRSSSALAGAYGVAVTTTMVVTSFLLYQVARERWQWKLPMALLMGVCFLTVDFAYWGANLLKVPHGGWFPLLVGAAMYTLFTTWKKGRQMLNERVFHRVLPREMFLESITTRPPVKVPGTAVYMYNDPRGTPPALLHNLKHNKVLHEQVVFLSVRTAEVPYVTEQERSSVEKIADGFHQVILNYGFMEDAHIPRALGRLHVPGLAFKPMETTYFLGRETLIPSKRRRGMWLWREKLFSVMSRNARSAASFFRLPPNRVVELGAQVEL